MLSLILCNSIYEAVIASQNRSMVASHNLVFTAVAYSCYIFAFASEDAVCPSWNSFSIVLLIIDS